MPADSIIKKSLVIAIWDEDSKSRDDYMAGIRISLKTVLNWTKYDIVELELRHQEKDGHVSIWNKLLIANNLFNDCSPLVGVKIRLKPSSDTLREVDGI